MKANYTFVLDIFGEELDQFVLHSSYNTLFQQSSWAKIKKEWAPLWTGLRDQDQNIVLAGLVLRRKLVFGKELWYLPRGPVTDYKKKEVLQEYFEQLKKIAARNHAIAIKFDPPILYHHFRYKDRALEHEELSKEEYENILSCGAKHHGYTTYIAEAAQPRFNAAISTTNFQENLEAKTKKYIRQATERGVVITEGPQELADFAKVMQMTEEKKSIALRNMDYYKNMQEVYQDHCFIMNARIPLRKQYEKRLEEKKTYQDIDLSTLSKKQRIQQETLIANNRKDIERLEKLIAEDGEVGLCSGLLGCYNQGLMELYYMGNNPKYGYSHASYLLYYTAISKAISLNIPVVSFGGVEGSLDDGLTLFKSNWPMMVEEYIGEFDIVLEPFWFHMMEKELPRYQRMVQKIKGKRK